MSTSNIKNKLKKTSKSDKKWIEKAKYRKENSAWLDISFAIAVKIMSKLKENKKLNEFPQSQKQLAKALDCSPQYVNKLLKGTENLQIETITRIEGILDLILIEVPEFETMFEFEANNFKSYSESEEIIDSETSTANYQTLLESTIYSEDSECNFKLVA
ncbi:MAG: helix-turn-helix transcriptional regulator [Zunongwangia sp.]|uniref:helix-turn-helix domain-containing protein n=1 Tax=Zunongwangia sp. TaxID=1965325 RepID=UPI003241EE13